MSIASSGEMQVGQVKVVTTQNCGLTPEYWADRALEKIVYVAADSNPYIRDQAEAFKDSIRQVLIYYVKQAITSDRTTLFNLLQKQQQGDMAEILKTL